MDFSSGSLCRLMAVFGVLLMASSSANSRSLKEVIKRNRFSFV